VAKKISTKKQNPRARLIERGGLVFILTALALYPERSITPHRFCARRLFELELRRATSGMSDPIVREQYLEGGKFTGNAQRVNRNLFHDPVAAVSSVTG
jgi:hypothetical protein